MNRLLALREKAKKEKKRIILPEGEDLRIIKAASFLVSEGLADVCVLGEEAKIKKIAQDNSISLEGVNIVDPLTCDKRQEIIDGYYQKRKHKGITPEEAEQAVSESNVVYAAMMTGLGLADGFVAGAINKTSTVARAAIHCLKVDREIGTVSSSFIMQMDESPFGENGLLIYGDCAIIPEPSPRQLAGIAIATSDQMQKLFDVEPRVALLSYSTKGSARSDSIDIVRSALLKVKEKRPNLNIDGELQVDAALVPEVAESKCSDSSIGGKANVLIFPNLDAGNIAYKLSQRLANARAVGPILQGLDKPCSDLSRGCSWEDVVDTSVVVAIKAQGV